MSNPNIAKAAKALATFSNGDRMYYEFGPASQSSRPVEEAAAALDSAGLLVTPLHERALRACEIVAREMDGCARLHELWAVEFLAIGRESLAAKKPVKSWCANGPELWLNGRFFSGFRSHAEANAAQSALNALEAK